MNDPNRPHSPHRSIPALPLRAGVAPRAGVAAFLVLAALLFSGTPLSAQERETDPERGSAAACLDLVENLENLEPDQLQELRRACRAMALRHRPHAAFPREFMRPGRGGTLGIILDARPDAEHAEDGVVVQALAPRGPAREAGVEEGDLIVGFSGMDLTRPLPGDAEGELEEGIAAPAARLLHLVRELEPGDTVSLQVRRNGEALEVTLVTGDPPRWPHVRMRPGIGLRPDTARPFRRPGDRTGPRFQEFRTRGWPPGVAAFSFHPFLAAGLGLTLYDLNEGLARYFGTDRGALVLDVIETPEVPLEPGDVILAIDGRKVADAARGYRILASYRDGESFTLEILRHGERMTVEGTRR
jgi:hypothetical protein